jgi:predicted DNA repair protein MutK
VGYRTTMVSQAAVWATVALLVLIGVIGVVAAFVDRRRGREIAQDRSRLPGTPPGGREGDDTQ